MLVGKLCRNWDCGCQLGRESGYRAEKQAVDKRFAGQEASFRML